MNLQVEDYQGQRLSQAHPALAKACYQIAEAAYPTGLPWSEATFLADQKMPQSRYVVARADDAIIGFVSVVQVLDQVDVTIVAVHPSHQHQGIETALFRQLFSQMPSPVSLFLEVRAHNQKAQTLYKKLGFSTIGRRHQYYRDPQEDALLMKKTL
ncbi:ribosomal protein S18-alanine N-acetyltransferase [Secundilactobacillus kimchicus]|uniref:ribosomal protein S18-alanine N-acetyltransferase n=1 Tax=Secundilactobacillus kimchicus TaxID=528209 RepID=UPI0024A94B2C|nr:ribosomal protein S18-alanine N-acetyltransferase [Secundilactobacillus kimchicus]